jgi:sec-independent protein translocase protein TatB
MFDIGWSELVVIGVVALIVIGPKELPGVLRMVGQWITKVRRMASDFQGQFQEAMREAEMADLKKQVDELADSARDLTPHFDPIGSMEEAIGDPFEEKPKIADKRTAEGGDPSAAPEPTGEVAAATAEPAPAAETATEAPPQRAAAGGHSA